MIDSEEINMNIYKYLKDHDRITSMCLYVTCNTLYLEVLCSYTAAK